MRGAVRRAVQVSGRAEPGRAPLVSIWEARELAEDAKGVGRSDVVEELRIDVLDDGDGARSKPRAPRRVRPCPSSDTDLPDEHRAYWGGNLERVRRVKETYDPEGVLG